MRSRRPGPKPLTLKEKLLTVAAAACAIALVSAGGLVIVMYFWGAAMMWPGWRFALLCGNWFIGLVVLYYGLKRWHQE